jgi:glucose/arabinose dehydrogenase
MSLCQGTTAYTDAWTADGFCAGIVPVSLNLPRSITAITTTTASEFVTLERGTESVVIVEDLDFDGIPESYRRLVTLDGLFHGFTFTSTHLYASTSNDVFRWKFDFDNKNVTSVEERVITNITFDGQKLVDDSYHSTRTLVWEPETETLYVHVGSTENVDENSYRARIRRFSIGTTTKFPIDFKDGEVFADGLRNEVAMEFSPKDGHLWGAGNSADLLFRADLGGPIYNDNPGEELHRFELGQHYGYPYCWREFSLPRFIGAGRGSAWSYSGSNADDRTCRNEYDDPVMVMQAHSAPLGLTFYDYKDVRPSECDGVIPFPREMDGYIFIAFHGSWNRLVPTGYKIVYIPLTADGKVDIDSDEQPIDLLRHGGQGAQWVDGFRPVDVSFDGCGRLLVSSDGFEGSNGQGAKVIRIESTSTTFIPPAELKRKGPIRQVFGFISALFFRLAALVRIYLF